MSDYLTRTDAYISSLGVESYRVGGSVRDELLGRRVKDADYVVFGMGLRDLGSILRASTRVLRRGAVAPLKLRDGRQAGWRVSALGLGCIEIMLPRTEVSTGPGHRDFEIVIDPSLTVHDDSKRRDFTFNALYRSVGWNMVTEPAGEVILDPTGRGKFDLLHRQINVTHADSFRDDPLRVLRALRFISTLGYELGVQTRALMALHADAVTGLTMQGTSGTVLDELSKLLMGQDPARALRVARDTGVLSVAFPELAPMLGFDQGSRYHDMTTDEHTFTALETAAHVDAPLRVRMALLFHDSGKPEAAWRGADGRLHYYASKGEVWAEQNGVRQTEDHEIVGERLWLTAAKRLNAPRSLTNEVALLIRNHMVPCMKADPVRVRRERVRLGDEMLRDLYLMRMCDLSGKGSKNRRFLENIAALEQVRTAAEDLEIPSSVKDLEINGHDVMGLSIEGRQVGAVLSAVLDEVVVDPSGPKLTYDWQLSAALRLSK